MKLATYKELRGVFKKDQADAIVSLVESKDEQYAIKGDIAEVKTGMAGLRSELKEDIAELRTDMANLKGELTTKINGGILATVSLQIGIMGLMIALKFL